MHCVFKQSCVIQQLRYKLHNSVKFSFFGPLALSFFLIYVPVTWWSLLFQSQHVSDSQHIPAHVKHPVDVFSMTPISCTSNDLFSPIVPEELVGHLAC